MMENRDVLGISPEVPEPQVQARRPIRGPTRGGRPGSAPASRDQTGGLQDLITNRLLDVNTAVFSTVSELRVGVKPAVNLLISTS